MKYPKDSYYVEVNDHQYRIHPIDNILLRLRDPPKSPRIQNQVQKLTQVGKNQKVIKNETDELIVKNYPKIKKQPIFPQTKYKPPECPSCKQNIWLDFNKVFVCQNCQIIVNNQKHQFDKKVFRQNHYFSSTLPYANQKMREIFYSTVHTTFNSSEDMINILQRLKGKTKLMFYQNISQYYDEWIIKKQIGNFQLDEDIFSKNVENFSKIYHEKLLLMKFLQTKSQIKSMNIIYYDLYYTLLKIEKKKKLIMNMKIMKMILIIMMILSLLIIILEEEMIVKN